MLNDKIGFVLDTVIAISKEKDRDRLLDLFLESCLKISNCEMGTATIFKTEENNSQTSHTVYAATFNSYNINEEYSLTLPLINQAKQSLGEVKFINAHDENNSIVAFSDEDIKLLNALSSQAAIALSNINYMEEIKAQMWSFTEAMAEAIDNRTPYNANHIRNVSVYCSMIADKINERYKKGLTTEYFSKERREALVMSALLHDIGKMVIPTSVMNKATKLGTNMKRVQNRAKIILLGYQIDYLQGKITEKQFTQSRDKLTNALRRVEAINENGFLSEDDKEFLDEACKIAEIVDGDRTALLTDEDKEMLLISKGTLSAHEREIMENHVIMTIQILSKVQFNSEYKHVPEYAAMHHEFLDGSGYPNHLTEKDFPLEAKILSVADICDALLATDRPYKKPLPKEEAFDIMYNMAKEGKLDIEIVKCLEEAIA